MYKHEFFNFYLHDNAELATILKKDIAKRRTLHEWPLSCVVQLETTAGKKWIYKTQFGPTVEATFYANARSPLLVSTEIIPTSYPNQVNLLIEFIDGPLVEDLDLSAEDTVTVGKHVIAEIAEIEGTLPHYLDISTEVQWGILMEIMLDNLRALISQGTFDIVDPALISSLKQWAFCEPVLAALGQDIGYVHHDLSGDNIFVLADRYRVIDWQRPILGPKALDMANLVASLGWEPLRYVDEGIVWIMYLLRIDWFTQCAMRWFPDGHHTYDKAISQLGSLLGRSA